MLLAFLLATLSPLQTAELAPLDFLVGHCWRGDLNAQDADTHCFTAGEGEVRDRHEVHRGGKLVYWGVTVYAWDAGAGAIRFTYSDPSGVVGKGTVRRDGRDLDFGTNQYAAGDKKVSITSRWVRVGDNAYDAVDVAPDAPAFNHTIRYTRVIPAPPPLRRTGAARPAGSAAR